jgi:hypothetical protein
MLNKNQFSRLPKIERGERLMHKGVKDKEESHTSCASIEM